MNEGQAGMHIVTCFSMTDFEGESHLDYAKNLAVI